MSSSSSASPSSRRDLRCIVADGVLFNSMVGLGETYFPAFVLAMGLGTVASAQIATLPILVGACFQVITPLMVRRLGSYRRWTVFCACIQALSFLPLIAGACLGRIPIDWALGAAAVYWAFGMSAGPAWNAWVTDLVPRDIRAGFFARRTQLAQVSLVIALLLGGLALEAGQRTETSLTVFAVLFALAALSRLGSAAYISRQSESPGLVSRYTPLPVGALLSKLRAQGALRVLAYLLAMQAAAQIAAPYFTAYMLGPLELSYGRFVTLIATAFIARIAVMPALGRFAHTHGARPLLWLGAVTIVPLPSMWLLSHDFIYLVVLQVLAGMAWGTLELATLLSFLEGIDDSDRTEVLSVFNLVNAGAIVGGATCGAWIFRSFGAEAYAYLFLASSAGRALAALLLIGRRASPSTAAEIQLRTLAVRPAAGAIQGPILSTLDDD